MFFWIHSWSYMSKFKKGGHTCHPIWYSNKIWTRLTIKKLLIISYTGTGKTIEAFVILLFLSELLPFYSFTIGIPSYFGVQWNTIKTITRRMKEMTLGVYSLCNSNFDLLQFGLSAKSTLFLLLQNNTASIFERVV